MTEQKEDEYEFPMGGGFLEGAEKGIDNYRVVKKGENLIIQLSKGDKLKAQVEVHKIVFAESVKEYKTDSDSSGGWEEATQHRVFILLETGQRKCPWCGNVEEYSGYNEPHYLADHRTGECPKCKRFAFVTHDHIDGVCQKIPSESLANFKSVRR